MQSQQLSQHGRTRELPTASEQQPSSLPRKKPVVLEAGFAAAALAALALFLVIVYVAASATLTRNGYVEMALTEEIESLHAETALLRYQVHVAGSSATVDEEAADLDLHRADPMYDVDYVLLPSGGSDGPMRLASGSPAEEGVSLAATLAEYAVGVVTVGGRAEASTTASHRH
jgi:hypothetical protein